MKKAWDHTKEQLEQFLNDYNYYKPASGLSQKSLTDELDSIEPDQAFDESTVHKILLWKIHRYADLSPDLLNRLNDVSRLTQTNKQEAKPVLEELLQTDGIDLPMASTLLRFRNPNVFQIIDRRAFRAVTEKDHYDLYSGSPVKRKVEVYFSYLESIDKLCEQTGINFADADRILYQFDKQNNGTLKNNPREGWKKQFRQMHQNGDDKLIVPDVLANEFKET